MKRSAWKTITKLSFLVALALAGRAWAMDAPFAASPTAPAPATAPARAPSAAIALTADEAARRARDTRLGSWDF